jgi:hypothetical protein
MATRIKNSMFFLSREKMREVKWVFMHFAIIKGGPYINKSLPFYSQLLYMLAISYILVIDDMASDYFIS